jgi:hypothetical protein
VRPPRRRLEGGQSPRRQRRRGSILGGTRVFETGRTYTGAAHDLGDRERGVEDDLGRGPALQPRRAGDQLRTEHGVDEDHVFVATDHVFVSAARSVGGDAEVLGRSSREGLGETLPRGTSIRTRLRERREELSKAASFGCVASRVESQREARDGERVFTLGRARAETPGLRQKRRHVRRAQAAGYPHDDQ